ncbi:uncharacterized protein LOC125177855 [Hyalella azteca]|uniref:Uncharacterized protein LOC125177855 n=1 Tax=Hyalella azteca TaxID=294128 RepID=A0A979FHX5_HYAAZ|nr:uncharacterized protein LOC125177855 [Hyalella azteca]
MYFYLTASLTLCQARAYCQSLGAQVASPTTHDNYLALMAYLNSKSYWDPIWAGVYNINGTYSYESNGRWPGPDQQYEWGPNQPNRGLETCTIFRRVPSNYSLADDFCWRNSAVICHAWNLEL